MVQDNRLRKVTGVGTQSKHKRERTNKQPCRIAQNEQRVVVVGGLRNSIAQQVEDASAERQRGRGRSEGVGDGTSRKRRATQTNGDRGRLDEKEPGVRRRQLAQNMSTDKQ